jgi:hypothetical protein
MKRSAAAFSLALAMFLAFDFAGTPAASAEPPPGSGIKGRVFQGSKDAVAGVYVYAYDSPNNDMRMPTQLISAPTAQDGAYALNLVPGTYYIVARKRVSGSPRGYLSKGDFEGEYPGNPVVVKAGEFPTVDLSVATLPGKFLLAPYANLKGDMGITGKVVKEDGKPVPGAYVMAYTRKDRMGRPAFLSKPTNQDGEYVIYPTQPGTYYVAARNDYGDLPRKGEPYGTYDKDPEHKVELKEKTVLTGIDIMMSRFTRDLTKCAEH